MIPYRVWINQPSTLQEYHHLHGKVGIVTDECNGLLTIYFTEGYLISAQLHSSVVSKCADAGKLATTDHPRD